LKLVLAMRDLLCSVAPRAGAWIETPQQPKVRQEPRSPPARGRGLKLCRTQSGPACRLSPPARGRGLKHTRTLRVRPRPCRPPRGGVD